MLEVRHRGGMGDITVATITAIKGKELDDLMSSVKKALQSVNDAYAARDKLIEQIDLVAAAKKRVSDTFGPLTLPGIIPVPNVAALMAMAPLATADAHIQVMVRRLAGIHLTFESVEVVYGELARALVASGLSDDGGTAYQAVQLMMNWRSTTGDLVGKKSPNFWTYRQQLRDAFAAALARRGLRIIGDASKDGYFDALSEVVGGFAEVPASGTSGMGDLGALPAILGLIKIALVVVAIIASLAYLNSIVGKLYGASSSVAAMSLEYQKRKTSREQAVIDGKLPRAEADAENATDLAETQREVARTTAAASKLDPGLPEVAKYIAYAAAAAGGVYVLSKVL